MRIAATICRIFLLLLFCNSNLFAQFDCTVKNFNTENGLPQNSIIDLTIGNDGYLWLATQSGLIRYDGNKFKTFTFSEEHPQSKNDVRYIMNIRASKTLLFGTLDGLTYSIRKGRPVLETNIPPKKSGDDVLKGAFPNFSFFQQFYDSVFSLKRERNFPSNLLNLLALNEKDFIVSSDRTDVLFYFKDGKKQNPLETGFKIKSLLPSQQYNFIEDEHANLYLFDSSSVQLKKMDISQQELIKSKTGKTNFVFFSDIANRETYCFYNDIFYLIRFDKDANLIRLSPQFALKDKEHLWTNVVYDSLSSTFFLSTLTEGIFEVKLKKIQTLNLTDRYPLGIEPGSIINYTILKTSDTTAVIPSGFDLVENRGHIFPRKLGKISGTRETMAMLPDKTLLCGRVNMLVAYSEKDGYSHPHLFNDSFSRMTDKQVLMLYTEGDSVWASNGTGLYCLNEKNAKLIFRNGSKDDQSILRLFYRLDADHAFIASETGSYKLKTSFPYSIDSIGIFKNKQIRHISRYKDFLILSVHNDGLYVMKENHFYKVPANSDQSEISSCHATYIDSSGGIWITTNRGLFRSTIDEVISSALQPQKFSAFFFYYGKNDGIDNTEFNGSGNPPYAVLKDEQLLLPSMGGIVSFKPKDLNARIISSPPFIENVSVDNNEIALLNDTIKLKAAASYVGLTVSVSYFGEPQNLVLDYQLDDSSWKKITVADNLKINLVNIGYGWHQLAIRKRIGFGRSDYSYNHLTIYKERQLHEKIWFYPVILIIGTLLIWLLLTLNTRSINRKKRQLQKLVNEQTTELSKTGELKDLLISIISHDMITPLRYVAMVAGNLAKTEIDPERAAGIAAMESTSKKILSGSLAIIDWMKYNNKKIALEKTAINLHQFVTEIFEVYVPIAKSKNIMLVNIVPNEQMLMADQQVLTTIFTNLVSNAIKYTSDSSITFWVDEMREAKTVVKLADTGAGMKADTLHMIQEIMRGNISVIKSSNKIGTGMGYLMISELAKIHEIKLSVESELGKGTTVTMEIG